MSTNNLDWHKRCLKNQAVWLENKKEAVERAQLSLKRSIEEHRFYAAQIELAEKEGKESFDSKKYGHKRIKLEGNV